MSVSLVGAGAAVPLNSATLRRRGTPASLLLHFDGDFNDSSPSGLNVIPAGSVAISATESKFGSGSLAPRSGASGLVVRNQDDDEYPSLLLDGDFTIEFWFNLTSTSEHCFFTQSRWQGDGTKGIAVWHHKDWPGKVTIWADDYSSGVPLLESSTAVSIGGWHHCAAQRSEGKFSIWLDGIKDAELTRQTTITKPIVGVGAYVDGGGNVNEFVQDGYIDDLRIVKGRVVYTGSFAPPAAPLSATAIAV